MSLPARGPCLEQFCGHVVIDSAHVDRFAGRSWRSVWLVVEPRLLPGREALEPPWGCLPSGHCLEQRVTASSVIHQ